MEKLDHLLAIVSEECSEVAQAAMKSLRFGIDDTNPVTKITNFQQIMTEFYELEAVIEMLNTHLGNPPLQKDRIIDDKKRRVEHWLTYSNKRGRLQQHKQQTESGV